MPKKIEITNNIRRLRFFANEMTQQELAEKEARLSAVNALLNIDGKNSIPDLMDDTLDIEPPQRAAKDYER